MLHAGSYTAGVLAAFAALGGALLALRTAGGAAGWGFQFQSPVFVAATAWVLFAVGLNLSGVFEVGGGRLSGAGHSLAAREGHLGNFFTGLLAVLVATPCTAPFMGAAVAGALAAPPVAAIAVFLAMGLGLAAPYATLVLVPGVARALPRPGRWMEVVRQALAFPMYGATVWLVWVASQQSGADGVLFSLAGVLLLGLAGWAFGLAQRSVHGGGLRRTAQVAGCPCRPRRAGAAARHGRRRRGSWRRRPRGRRSGTVLGVAAGGAAGGKPAGIRRHDGGVVRDLPGERTPRARARTAVRRAFAERGVVY